MYGDHCSNERIVEEGSANRLQQHQVAPQLQLLGMQSEINFINVTQSIYVKVIKLVREYASTLYVGLARAVSPTNTNFRLTFLLTRLQEALYEELAV